MKRKSETCGVSRAATRERERLLWTARLRYTTNKTKKGLQGFKVQRMKEEVAVIV